MWVLIVILNLAPAAFGDESRWRLAAGYEDVRANGGRSDEFFAEGAARYLKTSTLGYAYRRDSRVFKSRVNLADTSHRITHESLVVEWLALDGAFSYSPSPHFLPKQKIEFSPTFYFLGTEELSIRLSHSRYRTENVWSLRPEWSTPLADSLNLRLRGDWTISPQQALSGLTRLDVKWHRRLQHAVLFAAGKSYEGDQLTSKFWSAAMIFTLPLTEVFTARLSGSMFRSILRSEWRSGASLEAKF